MGWGRTGLLGVQPKRLGLVANILDLVDTGRFGEFLADAIQASKYFVSIMASRDLSIWRGYFIPSTPTSMQNFSLRSRIGR